MKIKSSRYWSMSLHAVRRLIFQHKKEENLLEIIKNVEQQLST